MTTRPHIRTVTEIKNELLAQQQAKLLKEKQTQLPDFTDIYFEMTKDYELVPQFLYQKPMLEIREQDEDEIFEQQQVQLEKYYEKMEKIDAQLYNKQENNKYKELLKAEIYDDKLNLEKQVQAELELQRQIELIEKEMVQKKREMQEKLDEELNLQKQTEEELFSEFKRRRQLELREKQNELEFEKKQAIVAVREMKQSSEMQLNRIKLDNEIQREEMLASMREGIFYDILEQKENFKEERYMEKERDITELPRVLENLEKAKAECQKVKQVQKVEPEVKIDEKRLQREKRATQLKMEREEKIWVQQEEKIREQAVKEMLGMIKK